jgi:lipoprotein NlpI
VADFTLALRFDAKSTDAYVLRGIASHYLGDGRQALSDANKGAELSPNLVTAALWLEIIGGRKAELAAFAARADLTAWPGPVVKMMLGETTLEALLAAAEGLSPNQKTRNTCQASFYAGQLRMLEGARDEARGLFEMASTVCPQGFIEWFAANAELKAFEKG